jgi:hypothetical protein
VDGGLVSSKRRVSYAKVAGRRGIGESEPLDFNPMVHIRLGA